MLRHMDVEAREHQARVSYEREVPWQDVRHHDRLQYPALHHGERLPLARPARERPRPRSLSLDARLPPIDSALHEAQLSRET